MVQKDDEAAVKRARGRPRAYDPDEALTKARDTFWQHGYSGTTLDDLSAATGMNRPSLYGAFGDKRALYLATLQRYIDRSRAAIEQVFASDLSLSDALLRIYDLALGMYFQPGTEPVGCFLIGTAGVEAVKDAQVRETLGGALRVFDDVFEARLRRGQEEGELDADADPAMLAKLASAVLHTLAVRSRAGDSRASLLETAEAGVAMICGGQAKRARGAKRR
jgi:AcrR family transcriptional regulator